MGVANLDEYSDRAVRDSEVFPSIRRGSIHELLRHNRFGLWFVALALGPARVRVIRCRVTFNREKGSIGATGPHHRVERDKSRGRLARSREYNAKKKEAQQEAAPPFVRRGQKRQEARPNPRAKTSRVSREERHRRGRGGGGGDHLISTAIITTTTTTTHTDNNNNKSNNNRTHTRAHAPSGLPPLLQSFSPARGVPRGPGPGPGPGAGPRRRAAQPQRHRASRWPVVPYSVEAIPVPPFPLAATSAGFGRAGLLQAEDGGGL